MIRAGAGQREVGDRPGAPQGGLSQNVEQQKKGWMTERWKRGGKRREGGMGALSLARLFLLRWVFRWGWLHCQKACSSHWHFKPIQNTVVVYSSVRIVKQRHPGGKRCGVQSCPSAQQMPHSVIYEDDDLHVPRLEISTKCVYRSKVSRISRCARSAKRQTQQPVMARHPNKCRCSHNQNWTATKIARSRKKKANWYCETTEYAIHFSPPWGTSVITYKRTRCDIWRKKKKPGATWE